jgi:Protein of unknown function (DUF664)
VNGERDALRCFLDAQRRSVLAIVDGLDERDLRRPVVPSGWTPLGMVEHLAHAERFWFTQVIAGVAGPPRGRPADEAVAGPFATRCSVEEVLAFYRRQTVRSDGILASTSLDSLPAGAVPPDMANEIHTVRDVILHMVEEVARHAGHLDIARELLDGTTALGSR